MVDNDVDEAVVIERTSKRYKAGMLFGVLLSGGSFLAGPVLGPASLVLMATGGICFLLSAIAAWWNHG